MQFLKDGSACWVGRGEEGRVKAEGKAGDFAGALVRDDGASD